MSELLREIEAYRRGALYGLHQKLTESQQRKFKRIFGCIENVRDDRVNDAIKICERTVKKNQANANKEKNG